MNSPCPKRIAGWAGLLLAAVFAVSIHAQGRPDMRLSFGRVSPDQTVEEVIVFNNPTRETLKVAGIELTPPLRAKDISDFVLPGQEGRFTLVLGEDRPPGPFEGQVRINFEGTAFAAITFEIEGYVIPPIEFVPFPAFFVVTQSGEQKTASIEIINHRDEPLYLTGAESVSERFTLDLVTIEVGRKYRLSLNLDGTTGTGRKTEEIALLADPAPEQPLRIQANTNIRNRVYHFPETVDMGALPYKVATDARAVETLSQILMVYRPGTSDFEAEAELYLDYVDLRNERGPAGDRHQFTVTLIPEKIVPGKIDGTIRIRTNDKEFGVLEVPISGYVLEPRDD